MHTLTVDELSQQPQRLVDEALLGRPTLVTQGGQPVFLAVPLGKGLDSQQVRLELAAALFDGEQISLGLAARIAGLGYSDMIDELGRRGMASIRLAPGDLERELAALSSPRAWE